MTARPSACAASTRRWKPSGPRRRNGRRRGRRRRSPSRAGRELGHGHHLDRREADLAEGAQVRDGPLERALAAEAAHVELGDDQVAQGGRLPARVRPREGARVEHARASAQALGLPAAAGVGQERAVDGVGVVRPRAAGHLGCEHPVAERLEPRARAAAVERELAGTRRPDPEAGPAVCGREGAQRRLPGELRARGHWAAQYPAVRCGYPPVRGGPGALAASATQRPPGGGSIMLAVTSGERRATVRAGRGVTARG
jgi:hypothetical protein